MPKKRFRVHIYDVLSQNIGSTNPTTTFQDAIENARRQQSIVDREKVINGTVRRLETSTMKGHLYLMNFVSFKYTGHGQVRRGQPIHPTPIQRDESFAPETAMLYDPKANIAFLESSQSGMRSSSVVRYFEQFANRGDKYSMSPRADADASARARQHQIISRLKIRIGMGIITAADHEMGLAPFKSFGNDLGAGYIDIDVVARRNRGRLGSMIPDSVHAFFDRLIRGSSVAPAIDIEVTGRENDDSPVDVIDLIQNRERRVLELDVDSTTRNVPYQARWDALFDMHQMFMSDYLTE